MVANIIAAFRKRIEALSWMDPTTKAEAQAKLNTLYVGIGYPESWHDYSGYEVKADDLFGNVWRGILFDYHWETSRLGKPVDRKEWSMTPQTVNAVNLPLQNALNFPAAILQPPFYDPKAPAAANYGAIGIGDRPRNQSYLRHRRQFIRFERGRAQLVDFRPTSHTLRRPPLHSPLSTTPTSRFLTWP